jgi:Fe-S cluster assembly ATP-binding protein
MSLLKISNLCVEKEDADILCGVDLVVEQGEVVVLMGPNGSGKSTLAHVLMGHPDYVVNRGDVCYMGKDLLALKPEERAKMGLFLSWQYPQNVPGVTVSNFLRLAHNAVKGDVISVGDFYDLLKKKMDMLGISHEMANRFLNEGFSGGEKKILEILQLIVLEPRLVILDEADSGLDVDALRVVGEALKVVSEKRKEMGILLITHNSGIVDYVVPDRIAIMGKGVIVEEGGVEMLERIKAKGFEST